MCAPSFKFTPCFCKQVAHWSTNVFTSFLIFSQTKLFAIDSAVLIIHQWAFEWAIDITAVLWETGTITCVFPFFSFSAFSPCLVSARIVSNIVQSRNCTCRRIAPTASWSLPHSFQRLIQRTGAKTPCCIQRIRVQWPTLYLRLVRPLLNLPYYLSFLSHLGPLWTQDSQQLLWTEWFSCLWAWYLPGSVLPGSDPRGPWVSESPVWRITSSR